MYTVYVVTHCIKGSYGKKQYNFKINIASPRSE